MKSIKLFTMVLAVMASGAAWAQTTFTNLTFNISNPNGIIPDANPVGLTLSQNLNLDTLEGPISDVTVHLDITGGFNGDLYAYLAGPNGGFAVLLNRSGVSGTSMFGYPDAGYDITFNDSGSNPDIHFYQDEGPTMVGGQLTGPWGSDGENIDPQSPPSSFTGVPTDFPSPSATLTSLNGTDPNGTWTLFLSDLSATGQSTVVSWGLDITAVPEPNTLALAAIGGLAVLLLRNSTHRRL